MGLSRYFAIPTANRFPGLVEFEFRPETAKDFINVHSLITFDRSPDLRNKSIRRRGCTLVAHWGCLGQ